jgi:multidrug transporter EmrE-like cation transporter
MRPLDLGLYVGSAILTAIGLTMIKRAAPFLLESGWGSLTLATILPILAAAAVYFSGMGLWLAAMGRNPLSTAYPIGIGLSLVSATIAAMLSFGEPIGAAKLCGIGLIMLGAAAIGRSKAE